MIFLRDIERCPYVPSDPEYAAWNEKNDERIRILVKARMNLSEKAKDYLTHEDENIRAMALFVRWILLRDE